MTQRHRQERNPAPADLPPRRMEAKHWAVLLATAGMFGSTFLFINVAVAEVPPTTLAAGRALLAAPIAWAFLRIAGLGLPPLGAEWGPLLILGVLTGVIPYTTIAWGQLYVESGLAGIIFGSIPVFSVILAPIFLREEKFTGSQIVGAGIVRRRGRSVAARRPPAAAFHGDDARRGRR